MKILIVSATENEILPLINSLEANNTTSCEIKDGNIQVDYLVTGIGSVFTTYQLFRKIHEKEYDFVINTGIAGSFTKKLTIGDVVFVQNEQFADLGIEDKNEFYTLFEKGFMQKNQFPFTDAKLINPYTFDFNIKKVSAITVNTTHGCEKSIELFKNKFGADIESMEGAAVFYVCLSEGVKFMEIRSISNYVEERNASNWDIPLAINNLNKKLLEIIDKIEQENTNWESL